MISINSILERYVGKLFSEDFSALSAETATPTIIENPKDGIEKVEIWRSSFQQRNCFQEEYTIRIFFSTQKALTFSFFDPNIKVLKVGFFQKSRDPNRSDKFRNIVFVRLSSGNNNNNDDDDPVNDTVFFKNFLRRRREIYRQ